MTKQRQLVYDILFEENDHPAAQIIFERAKKKLPNISYATIYNCLEALVSHKIVKQVNLDRGPSKYCVNTCDHGHFHDLKTGEVIDIAFKDDINLAELLDLPEGVVIEDVDIKIKGFIKN